MGLHATPPREVGQWLTEYIRGSDNPDLRAYGAELLHSLEAGAADRFMWFVQYLMRLGRMCDVRVLDVGCGFGWQAVAVSMLGGNHVVANDIRETMTGPVTEQVAALRARGADVSVDALTGDICALDLEQGSFDAIMCNETIEHVHDLEAMFRVCFGLLRPGGRCVISNDSNALNQKLIDRSRGMWERRERSWEYIEQLKQERPIENRDIRPYAVIREDIVRRSNPQLHVEQVRAIVAATAGMVESQIAHLAESYTDEASLPTPPELSWCRNPTTGEYCERLLDPFEVVTMMERSGFRSHVRHAFRRLPLSLLNGLRFRPLNVWLFNLRGIFVIVGYKPK